MEVTLGLTFAMHYALFTYFNYTDPDENGRRLSRISQMVLAGQVTQQTNVDFLHITTAPFMRLIW